MEPDRRDGQASDPASQPPPESSPRRRVFLSYGHDAHEMLAERLKADLVARGHEVWFDKCRLRPGEDWETCIERGLNWAGENPEIGRLVLLMTPHSVGRPEGYCLNELARGLDRRLPIVPVMVVWVEPPLCIARIQWLDMQDCLPPDERQSQYEVKFDWLVKALESGRRGPPGVRESPRALPSPQPKDSPWVPASPLEILEPLPFDADVAYYLPRFTGREWLLREVDKWLAHPADSRVFWLTGDPGVGKTAIACWLARHRREVAALHLCRYGHTQKADPRRCVTSIAYQLSTQLPEYQSRLGRLPLEGIVAQSNAATLFDALIVQPLATNFPSPDRPILVIIDGLDEATEAGKNELAAFLAGQFDKTPLWMRLLITSRPDPAVTGPLQGIDPCELAKNAAENEKDLRQFFGRELAALAGGEVPAATISTMLARSEGVFLYADWLRRELEGGRLTLDRAEEFPQGLGGVYDQMFGRQFPDLRRYETEVAPALDVIAAAKEPPEPDMLKTMFQWTERQVQHLRIRLGPLFPDVEGRVRPFHSSLLDWLTDGARSGHYFVDREEGHRRLADFGWSEYRAGIPQMTAYSFAHLPAHLIAVRRWDDLGSLLTDTGFLQARCDRKMVYGLVSDLAAVAAAGQPLKRISQSLLEVFCGQHSERLRQQMHGALSQSFGRYRRWPADVRECFEGSENLDVMDFLGLTLDREREFEHAEAVFRKLVRLIPPFHTKSYANAVVQLAFVLEHEDKVEEGLALMDELISRPEVVPRGSTRYYRVQYHRGIFLRRLLRYKQARAALDEVHRHADSSGMRIGGLHQLAVIDLELGRLADAEAKFQRCRSRRGSDPMDHRRAFAYRRLGQVYALMGRLDKSQHNFQRAIEISTYCGNYRYVEETQNDRRAFLQTPDRWRGEQAERLQLPDTFRALSRWKQGYLETLDPATLRPTGDLVRWDLVHALGLWHATVMVLVWDEAGRLCLQQRGESDSRGRWDVSVSGHRDFGESDVKAALRETGEELGLTLDATQLEPFGEPLQFIKEGSPAETRDHHVGPYHYRYCTEKKNCERTSVFLARISEDDKGELAVGPGRDVAAVDWVSLDSLAPAVEAAPGQYASAVKQLLHPEIVERLRRQIESRGGGFAVT